MATPVGALEYEFLVDGDRSGIIFGPFSGPALTDAEVADFKAFFGSPIVGKGEVVEVTLTPHPRYTGETAFVVVWASAPGLSAMLAEAMSQLIELWARGRALR